MTRLLPSPRQSPLLTREMTIGDWLNPALAQAVGCQFNITSHVVDRYGRIGNRSDHTVGVEQLLDEVDLSAGCQDHENHLHDLVTHVPLGVQSHVVSQMLVDLEVLLDHGQESPQSVFYLVGL